MKKTGQVAIFVIVAILIVSVVVLFFVLREGVGRDSPELNNVNSFVRDCIRSSGEDVLYELGQHGGYFIPTKLSTNSGVAYYIFEDTNFLPLREKVEDEISDYVGKELFFCVNDFVDFPDFEVEQDRIIVETEMRGNKVILDVRYPLYITKGDSAYSLEEFEDIKLSVRLEVVYNVAFKIIEEQLENPESICLSCLVNLGIENDLYIDMFNYDEDTVIYIIRDKNSPIDNEPYEFKFAVRYG